MTTIKYIDIKTPLGNMTAAATRKGICLLEFNNGERVKNEFEDLMKIFDAGAKEGGNMHLNLLKKELDEYFARNRKEFTVSLDIPGSDFQIKVWEQILLIPYGKTISYKEQAEAMGNADAVRAVAHANGQNRVSIVIPCHRVIGSNGKLVGYGGGLPKKKWLIDFEKGISANQPGLF
jgi:O-6-methylguanine DNA methyltransferase